MCKSCMPIYLQVTGAFSQFDNVYWPPIFDGFLALVRKPIELFSSAYIVPMDCLIGSHFSFYKRLLGVLLLPFFCSFCFVIAAVIAIFLRWRQVQRGGRGLSRSYAVRVAFTRLLMSPTSWSFHIWMLLLFYPLLCRNALTPFACVNVRSYSYLRADLHESCQNATWTKWAFLSAMFVLLYCLGIPAGMFVAARSSLNAKRAAWWGPRVSLLLASYSGGYWWFESFDMLRKFALASLVIYVDSSSRTQLWFGSVVASATALLYLKLTPYRSQACHLLQVLVQLQVLFTYLAASLFYVAPDSSSAFQDRSVVTDVLLVVANCGCFVLLAVLLGRTLHTAASGNARRLIYRTSGAEVEPPVLGDGDEWHVFLSHQWQAQDQCRIIKQRLLELIPGLRVFLDIGALSCLYSMCIAPSILLQPSQLHFLSATGSTLPHTT